MTASSRLAAALVAGCFVAFHLLALPPSLEDLDSVNFALGIRDYDVSKHQPHPPGYPLFIGTAKLLHSAGFSEVHTLSLMSVVAGGLAVFALLILFRELDRDRSPGPLTWAGVLLVIASPLYWITAARPLSDLAGLCASLFVQGLVLAATGVMPIAVAAFAAAFAAGIRSQVVWLTVPLLALSLLRLPRVVRLRGIAVAAGAYTVGVLLWLIPLIVVSGGPRRYWQAFFNQGAEDLTGVVMLATTPTLRQFVRTLQYAFVWPWGYRQLAAVVLVLAAVGAVQLLIRSRWTVVTLLFAFGPYLAFDLLFQETITTRYALPLVIPVCYLAMRGASVLPPLPALATVGALAVVSGYLDDRTGYGFGQMPAPAFRMLSDMHARAAEGAAAPPVLAMHRRGEFDMRRPIQWVGSEMPALKGRLPSPPKHEWLELVKYWNGGGRDPVWFIADPLRSDLALAKYERRPALYRWPFDLKILLGGARPDEVDWHVIDPPLWYAGEGWSLTPETAGIAREDRRGPGQGGITAWVRRHPVATSFVVGGRNLALEGAPARVRIRFDGAVVDEVSVPPGFFLRLFTVPASAGGDYAAVTIDADSPQLAIEQFDAEPAGRVVYGFSEGWHEQEYDPATGVLWRWSSDKATMRVRAEGHGLFLTMRGEVEAAATSHVTVRAGETVLDQFEVGRSFSRTLRIPDTLVAGPESTITIESGAWYVPAETRWRSGDRRRLGLKMLECRLTPAS